MKVYKFGGSSVADASRIDHVTDIVARACASRDCRAVVFSAFQGVTDQLIAMARDAAAGRDCYVETLTQLEEHHLEVLRTLVPVRSQSPVVVDVKMQLNDLDDVLQGIYLIRELTPRTLDFIMSMGERLSAFIISRVLEAKGVTNDFVDARDIVRTDAQFGSASVDYEETNRRIAEHMAVHRGLQVVTGFIGATAAGETTTLGRGGSDLTASILGAAIDAEEVVIWTDVDGVMTADPRKVRKAFVLERLTYEEAMEMTHFGAGVLYPPAVQPAMMRSIPVRIRNTFKAESAGTLISATDADTTYPIKGISSIDHVALILLKGSGMVGAVGVAERLFGALARGGVNTILISQASSEHTVCFAVAPEDAQKAKALLQSAFEYELSTGRISEIVVEEDLCIVAVVGENMRQTPGMAGQLFRALGSNGINISAIAQGSSELNISAVLNRADEQKALIAIHDAFFLSGSKSINLFVVGTGTVGGTLLDQIVREQARIARQHRLDLRLIAVGNKGGMLFDLNGVELEEWNGKLNGSSQSMDLDRFIEQMKELNLPNSIFVDCTSSEAVASRYLEILESSISVVTPNKKACSSSQDYYSKLKGTALRRGVQYNYETNVGAGLPVIRTIQDMSSTGDQIEMIEGVLSGTLSYLFNTYDGSEPFSSLVKRALEMGYTEPDPRDDLNGMDVARKILILGREAGFELELDQVHVEPILPPELFEQPDVEHFLEALASVDDALLERLQVAQEEGRRLRHMARVTEEGAQVGLQALGPAHPCYGLESTDNQILIRSQYYRERPMVITGPGAGPEVTASGVFSDIIKVAA